MPHVWFVDAEVEMRVDLRTTTSKSPGRAFSVWVLAAMVAAGAERGGEDKKKKRKSVRAAVCWWLPTVYGV
jgi:hypothetical protein